MPQVPQPPGQGETVGESMFGRRQGGKKIVRRLRNNTFFGGCERLKIEFMIYTYIYTYTLYLKKCCYELPFVISISIYDHC